MSGGCGCAEHGDEDDDDNCLQELLGGSTEVRADRAFLALPKYVGFFEAFLEV
jgi:hypothetical protein